MPGPVVANRDTGVGDRDLDRPVLGPPGDGVLEQVDDRPVEPGRRAAHERRLERESELPRGGSALDPFHRVRDEDVEPHVLDLVVPLAVASELDEIADERCELLELRDDVGDHPGALLRGDPIRAGEQLDIRPDARERRPELVGRVGHEVPLGGHGPLERGEHLVDVEASRLSSSSPVTSIRRRQIGGPCDVLGGVRQPPDRHEGGSCDQKAEDGRAGDARERDRDQNGSQPAERLVHLARGPARRARRSRGRSAGCTRERGAPSISSCLNPARRRPAATRGRTGTTGTVCTPAGGSGSSRAVTICALVSETPRGAAGRRMTRPAPRVA